MPNERAILQPGPPDLPGRLPSLEAAGLNQGAEFLPLEEQHARRRSLAVSLAGIVLIPWAMIKGIDAGLLGWGDALALGLAGEIVTLIGAGWALVPYRQELTREKLRARRARLETDLVREGYAVLFAGWEAAIHGTYGKQPTPRDPVVVSPTTIREQIGAVGQRIDDLPAQLAAALAQLAGGAAAAVLPEGTPDPEPESTPDPDPESAPGPDLVDVLQVAAIYSGSAIAAIVTRAVRNQPHSLRALAQGDGAIMSREEYEEAAKQLIAAGIFIPQGKGKAPALADRLMSFRAKWQIAAGDEATQAEIEDVAATWAVDLLAEAAGKTTLFIPSPIG